MSKTYDANSMIRAAEAYLKRFAASVTDWLNRYRSDPFFRTEFNIISLQVAFAVILLGLVGTSFSFLNHDVSTAIVEGIRAGAASHSPADLAQSIVTQIQDIRNQNLLLITLVIVVVTTLFGYIIARITLQPARNALAAQKQFIGNIAHELRTPLAVIKTNTEVAQLENKVPAEMQDLLESTVEELDRISEIINNLLSLSALVKPERMEFASVDLSRISDEVVRKFTPLSKRSGQQITVRKSPEALVWGNATALQQIVGNLVKNAIQYTPRGGQVRVTVEPSPDGAVDLLVQDSGMGIARKDLFRIFEPFYRSDPSRTKATGGSGLGLTIVSELVKMHHGKITLRSAVGRGTSVAIRFPGLTGRGVVGQELSVKDDLNEIAVDFSNR